MIVIEKDTLVNQLEMVKAGLSAREFIEQSSCFVFGNRAIMTFNDEIACRMETSLDVTGAVQASPLLAILEKIPDKELKVSENDKGELEFRGRRRGFGLVKDAEIHLPIDRVETPEKWVKIPINFMTAIQKVQYCVSKEESKFLLCCVHIAPNHIEACDNTQIMRFKVKSGLRESVLVRGTSIRQVVDLGMTHMSMTKSWLHFKNKDGLILSCRSYVDEYDDLSRFLRVKGYPLNLPPTLKEVTERASVFGSDKAGDPVIEVSLRSNKCRVSGNGLTGWYQEIKDVKYEGPKLDFIIAPNLLTYVVEECKEVTIGDNMLKAVGEGWQYATVLGIGDDGAE